MATEPMAEGDDPFTTGVAAQWTTRPIAYNATFEDSVMRTVLTPPQSDGIILLKDGDDAPTDEPSSIRSAIDASTLPEFAPTDLPLPLDHPSRIYRSTVPGIRYTHPDGALEGGEGPGAAERADYVQRLVEEHRLRSPKYFWQVVEVERRDALRLLEERMRAREKAIRQNEDVEAQLVQKKEQRDLEVRVWERRMGAKG